MDFIKIILPAVLTIIGNIVFYLFIQKKANESIEKYKVVFSGIYKEKIDVYRNILQKIYAMKYIVIKFCLSGQGEENEIKLEIHSFINYFTVNQMFFSNSLLKKLTEYTNNIQEVFKDCLDYYQLRGIELEPNEMERLLKKVKDSTNQLTQGQPFSEIEKMIIHEMRNDLNVNIMGD